MTSKTHTPSQHSVTVGGSSAGRIIACPASLKLALKMPKGASSDYADEGTALHNCVEHCLYEGLCAIDTDEIQALVGQEFYGVKMTQEHIDTCIIPALEHFDAYYAKLENEDGQVLAYAIETQVHMPGVPDAFGTSDITMVTPKRSVIWDWKFGGGVAVSAEDNSQLKFYARAAAYSAPHFFWPDPGEVDVEKPKGRKKWPVDLVISQPRIHPDRPSVWPTTFGELEKFRKVLVAAADEALNADEPRWARGEHCRWCDAKPICPKYKDAAAKLALLAEKGDEPDELPVIPVPPNEEFTPKDLRDWMRMADIVSAWAKSIGELVMTEAKAGRPPKGMKLVEKRGNTAWVEDDPAAIDRMLARRKLPLAERRNTWKPITPTQAAAKLKKLGKELPADATTRRVTGVVLVPKDDPRPAIQSAGERAKIAGEKLAAKMAGGRADL